jgi:hypothetical protein
VLTHFSQRYDSGDAQQLAGEAAIASGSQVVLAHDMTGSPFRPGSRQRPANSHPAGTSSGGPTLNGDRMPVLRGNGCAESLLQSRT